MKDDIKKKLSDVLELPKDIILDLVRLTITGRLAVFIENHKGIIEYDPQLIRVNTTDGVIVIRGKGLYLKSAIADEITIEGELNSIEFED